MKISRRSQVLVFAVVSVFGVMQTRLIARGDEGKGFPKFSTGDLESRSKIANAIGVNGDSSVYKPTSPNAFMDGLPNDFQCGCYYSTDVSAQKGTGKTIEIAPRKLCEHTYPDGRTVMLSMNSIRQEAAGANDFSHHFTSIEWGERGPISLDALREQEERTKIPAFSRKELPGRFEFASFHYENKDGKLHVTDEEPEKTKAKCLACHDSKQTREFLSRAVGRHILDPFKARIMPPPDDFREQIMKRVSKCCPMLDSSTGKAAWKKIFDSPQVNLCNDTSTQKIAFPINGVLSAAGIPSEDIEAIQVDKTTFENSCVGDDGQLFALFCRFREDPTKNCKPNKDGSKRNPVAEALDNYLRHSAHDLVADFVSYDDDPKKGRVSIADLGKNKSSKTRVDKLIDFSKKIFQCEKPESTDSFKPDIQKAFEKDYARAKKERIQNEAEQEIRNILNKEVEDKPGVEACLAKDSNTRAKNQKKIDESLADLTKSGIDSLVIDQAKNRIGPELKDSQDLTDRVDYLASLKASLVDMDIEEKKRKEEEQKGKKQKPEESGPTPSRASLLNYLAYNSEGGPSIGAAVKLLEGNRLNLFKQSFGEEIVKYLTLAGSTNGSINPQLDGLIKNLESSLKNPKDYAKPTEGKAPICSIFDNPFVTPEDAAKKIEQGNQEVTGNLTSPDRCPAGIKDATDFDYADQCYVSNNNLYRLYTKKGDSTQYWFQMVSEKKQAELKSKGKDNIIKFRNSSNQKIFGAPKVRSRNGNTQLVDDSTIKDEKELCNKAYEIMLKRVEAIQKAKETNTPVVLPDDKIIKEMEDTDVAFQRGGNRSVIPMPRKRR